MPEKVQLQSIERLKSLVSDLEDMDSKLKTLLSEECLHESLKNIEGELAQTPDCLKTRLLWIHCQLHIGAVPVTALTAALDEISDQLTATPEFHAHGTTVFTETAEKLLERDKLRVAVVMLERALALARLTETVSPAQADEIQWALLEVLSEEIERAERRRDSAKYISSLRDKISLLEQEVSQSSQSGRSQSDRSQNPASSADALSNAADSASEDPHAESIPRPPLSERLRKQASSFLALLPLKQQTTRYLPWATAGIAAICLLSVFWSSIFTTVSTEEIKQRASIQTAVPATTLAMLPQSRVLRSVDFPSGATNSSDFQALTTRLKDMGTREKVIEVAAPVEEQVDVLTMDSDSGDSDSGGSDSGTYNSGGSDADALNREFDRKPMDAPRVQGFGFAKKNEMPKYNSYGRYANTQVQSLGSTGKVAPIRRENAPLWKGADGKLYGPPMPNTSGRMTLDGKPLQAYQVEQLPTPKLYRIITPTKVMSAPSFISRAYDVLDPEVRVKVISRMGPWLELEPSRGRRAYIFAQDAKPLK